MIGNDGIDLPCQELFIFLIAFINDPYRELIINLIEGHPLFYHFIPDGINGLWPALYFVFKAFLIEGGLQYFTYFFNIGILLFLALFDLDQNIFIDFRLGIFKAKVLEFGLDIIEAYTVGQGGIDIQGFRGDLYLLVGTHLIHGLHVMEPVRDLNDDHPYIVVEGEQHLTEVLGLQGDVHIFLSEEILVRPSTILATASPKSCWMSSMV